MSCWLGFVATGLTKPIETALAVPPPEVVLEASVLEPHAETAPAISTTTRGAIVPLRRRERPRSMSMRFLPGFDQGYEIELPASRSALGSGRTSQPVDRRESTFSY